MWNDKDWILLTDGTCLALLALLSGVVFRNSEGWALLGAVLAGIPAAHIVWVFSGWFTTWITQRQRRS